MKFLATQAGTFKPFVRSRYSLRWRKTTETPVNWDSSTAAAVTTKEDVVDRTTKILEGGVDNFTENNLQVTTMKSELRTSTHIPDYDYYGNNEVEDGEHKN